MTLAEAPYGGALLAKDVFIAPPTPDPVTGSAHCLLAPYWSKKLGKQNLMAYQASPRGGILKLQLDEQNQRVLISGEAVTVMTGTLFA
ncbi:hypothetical protein MA16_Dca015630 [Dendrobium catenatum]|uniref:Uncharacterized protein n=1 Tax=Dendrobium catenatum TaxID=906689 RepID=A0A2I0WJA8_9ASPA|nr:hypothetical protein MA16_Dca015630 [Dendrobium catenatum]